MASPIAFQTVGLYRFRLFHRYSIVFRKISVISRYESRGRQLARAMKPEFPPGLSPAQIEALKKKQAELANPELAAANKSKKKKNKKKQQQAKESKENNNVVDHEQQQQQDVISLENGVKTLTVNSSEENGAEKVSPAKAAFLTEQ